ncbi:MAG: Crp/Fnr family transcriptional regulator [Gemmatimonadota bacterium]|nr:Crp/Fnr family transcriptional regulator [Gemmatimonadota bacterium]
MLAVQLSNIARLPREQRHALAAYGARATWPAGFSVYDRGAHADGIFIVLRGQVVIRTQATSRRAFVLWVATAGETFGGEGLEPSSSYPSHARAEEESVTLHIGSARFSTLLREQPALALTLIRQIVAERTALLEKVGQHATLTVEQRLVAALIRLAHSGETDDAVPRPAMVSRRLLGELVGATRESISLVIGRLTSDGLISRDGTGLVINDLRRLSGRLDAVGRGEVRLDGIDESGSEARA